MLPASAASRVAGKGSTMERKRVNSSRIRAVGYDPKSRTLEVEFSDGRVMAYDGVSPEIHRQFMAAPSATSFFEDKIAEDYAGRRL
jgi:hypothetical protein